MVDSASSGDFSRQVGSSIAWSFLDKWLSRAFSLAVFVILGRLLTPADFGVVALATAFVAFVTIFVDAGFGNAIIRQPNLSKVDIGTAFSLSAGAGLVLAIVSFFSAGLVSEMFGAPEAEPVLQAMSISLLLQGLSSVPAALLERDMNFKALAIRRSIATAVSGAAAVTAALIGFGVWALVVQTLGFVLIGGILAWIPVWGRIGIALNWSSLKNLWETSVGVLGIQLVTFGNSQADRLVVGIFLGVDALGQYFFAMRIISLCIELFTAVFSNVGLSAFSRLQNEKPKLLALLYRLTGVTSIATVPVFAFIGAFASVIVPVVFGPQWVPSIPILQVLVFLGAINSLLIFDRSVLIAIGMSRTAFLLSVGQAIFGVLFLVIAGPLGLVWIAVAVVARQYIFWPVRLIVLKRAIGFSVPRYVSGWSTAMLGMILAWAAAWACFEFLASPLGPWLALGSFVVIYAAVYLLLARTTLTQLATTVRSISRRRR